MDWKKILMKDFGKFRDVPLKTQPKVVDLAGSIEASEWDQACRNAM